MCDNGHTRENYRSLFPDSQATFGASVLRKTCSLSIFPLSQPVVIHVIHVVHAAPTPPAPRQYGFVFYAMCSLASMREIVKYKK